MIHVAIPHTSRFTIVGNHLAQHAELSLVAIGIGVHIQSLPVGSLVGIKALAARFTEGEMRIAAALRELEAHGYLHRTRVRLAQRPDGDPHGVLQPAGGGVAGRGGGGATRTGGTGARGGARRARTPTRARTRPRTGRSAPPGPRTAPHRAQAAAPAAPQPRELTPELRQTAAAILADLRNHAEELMLSEGDVEELIPGVATWLEREVRPDAIRRALTTDLPKPPKYPAKIVRHRLTVLLPPPPPSAEELAPAGRRTLVIPLQNCDRCDRAFRSREPGRCRGCRSELAAAAA